MRPVHRIVACAITGWFATTLHASNTWSWTLTNHAPIRFNVQILPSNIITQPTWQGATLKPAAGGQPSVLKTTAYNAPYAAIKLSNRSTGLQPLVFTVVPDRPGRSQAFRCNQQGVTCEINVDPLEHRVRMVLQPRRDLLVEPLTGR